MSRVMAMQKMALLMAGFIIGRGALFFSPIIVANLLVVADYGAAEYTQSIASMLATVLALGTASMVPLVLIGTLNIRSWVSLLAHQALIGAACVLIALALWALGFPKLYWAIALSAAALLMQTFWSAVLKSHGYQEVSVILDAGYWVLILLAVLGAFAFSAPSEQFFLWMMAALGSYAVSLLIYTIAKLHRLRRQFEFDAYQSVIRSAVSLMAASFLAVLANYSGRLGVGLLANADVLGVYGILFRGAALPIVAHQLAILSGFRKLYTVPAAQLSQEFLKVIVLVVLAVCIFAALGERFSFLLGPVFRETFGRFKLEGLLILAQCVLWSAISVNDIICAREGAVRLSIAYCFLYFIFAIPCALLCAPMFDGALIGLVVVHSILMLGYYLAQIAAMIRHGLKFHAIWASVLISFLALSTIFYSLR